MLRLGDGQKEVHDSALTFQVLENFHNKKVFLNPNRNMENKVGKEET